MSKTQIAPPVVAPKISPEAQAIQEQQQQIFVNLSRQFKDPIRNSISHLEEQTLTAINGMIQQVINSQMELKKYTSEILRLRKLCDDNKINHIANPPKNREQRRREEKTIKKQK